VRPSPLTDSPGIRRSTLFTGVGFAAFLVLNGYLVGWEYSELAAIRHLALSQAVELRSQRSFAVFVPGMISTPPAAEPVDASLGDRVRQRMMKRLAWQLARSRRSTPASGKRQG
jgi:CysZ protein